MLERALLFLDILATFLNNARQQATEYSSTIQLRFELISEAAEYTTRSAQQAHLPLATSYRRDKICTSCAAKDHRYMHEKLSKR